jgi:hypothetical protein
MWEASKSIIAAAAGACCCYCYCQEQCFCGGCTLACGSHIAATAAVSWDCLTGIASSDTQDHLLISKLQRGPATK